MTPLRCTSCKKRLPVGQGNQYVDESGEMKRVCNICWKRFVGSYDKEEKGETL